VFVEKKFNSHVGEDRGIMDSIFINEYNNFFTLYSYVIIDGFKPFVPQFGSHPVLHFNTLWQ